MASLGRCVSPAMVGVDPGSTKEQPRTVHFAAGKWYRVYDADGEVMPWVNINGWIKGQLKEEQQNCVW